MKRVLLLTAAVVGLASCKFKLDGPPLVIEMPEVGAQVDVSGWKPFVEPSTAVYNTSPKLEPGVGPHAQRFAKNTMWSSSLDLRATKIPYPSVEIRRVGPINASYHDVKTLEDCAKNETQEVKSPAISSWKLITPPVKKQIGGVDVLEVTNELTTQGLDWDVRTHWVFLAKGGYCYGIGTRTRGIEWNDHAYLMDPVIASLKPL